MTELKEKEASSPWEINQDGEVERVLGSVAVTWKAMSFRQKYSYFVRNVTVEPTILLFLVPRVLAALASQNLSLEKACRVNLAFSDEVCTALTSRNITGFKDEEIAVQQLVAGVQIWKTPLISGLPTIMILFIGAWSDRTGVRKPLMLFPIVGEIFSNISSIICTYWFYEIPLETVGILESIWPALFGGWITLLVGAFSYITDVTPVESRMIRIGIVNVLVSAGLPLGSALSGVVYAKLGFYGVFGLATFSYVLSFIHCLIWVKEVPRPVAVKQEVKTTRSSCGFFIDVFAIRHVTDTLKVFFAKGARNRKIKIVSLMIIHMVVVGPSHGEAVMMYLFSRYQFGWNEVQFSVFSTYNMIANLTGMAISIWLFCSIWKLDDALVGVISCMSKIFAAFVYAFATTSWVMYLAPVVECMNGAAHTSMRSISSKLVPNDELGKINALFGVCDALMPLAYVPMYSSLYRVTLDVLPGAFFLLGGGLTVPAVVLFLWLYTESRINRTREAVEVSEEAYNESDELNEGSETSHVHRSDLENTAFKTRRAECL